MKIEEHPEQNVVVIAPTDELLTAEVVRELQRISDSRATMNVILDLQEICSLVSGSLYPEAAPFTPLMALNKQLNEDQRRLVLCNLQCDIAEVFRLTRLDTVFEIQTDRDTALAQLP